MTISLNALNSRAHAPGFSILCLARTNMLAIHSFSDGSGFGKFCFDVFQNRLTLKLHSSAGDIVKNIEGGPKCVHNPKSFVLASRVASSA